MADSIETAKILIVGGGPAGASCALWLRKLGYDPLLVERRGRLGGLQNESPYENDWLAGLVGLTGQDFAAKLDGQLRAAGVRIRADSEVTAIDGQEGAFRATLRGGDAAGTVKTRFLVAATGVRAEDGGLSGYPGVIVGPGRPVDTADFTNRRVAILGGGDNAFENHGIISRAGAASVTVFARSLRARRDLQAQVPGSDLRCGPYAVDAARLTVAGEVFDRLVVLYGWRPNNELFAGLSPALDGKGYIRTHRDTAESSVPGLYALGELANRHHPCCATALADGVTAARAIQMRIEGRAERYSAL